MKLSIIGRLGLLLALAGLLSSCSTTPKILNAIAKDKASWKIHVQTLWGSADYVRIGDTTNSQNNPFP